MTSADEWKIAGNDYYKEKNYRAAIDAYSQAISLEPDNTNFYTNRAAAHIMILNVREVIIISLSYIML